MVSTKKSGPGLRYNLLAVLFLLFIGATCITFGRQLQLANSSELSGVLRFHPVPAPASGISSGSNSELNMVADQNNFVEKFVQYINANASLVVAIWFIVLCAHCIKLLANIGYIQRIRYHKTHSPPEFWESKIGELAARLRIRKQVELLESEIVKIPMVIGLLKPVILFPISLLSQLPQQQVEAVLLHELAHIKRKDYFVNLIQSFAEILFFFNPGVLWVSTLIREERENCCDDIVLGETRSKNELIYALVSFQEYNLSGSKYLTTFPGRKNHLLNRIKRILTSNNKTLNNMEKIALLTGIVIAGFIVAAFVPREQMPGNSEIKLVRNLLTDTIPPSIVDTVPFKQETQKDASSSRWSLQIDGKRYEIEQQNDKVLNLYVNGQRVPENEMGKYRAVIDKIKKDEKQNLAKMKMKEEELLKQEDMLRQKEEELNRQFGQMREQMERKDEQHSAELEHFNQEQSEHFNQEQIIRQNELKLKLDQLRREQDIKAAELEERMAEGERQRPGFEKLNDLNLKLDQLKKEQEKKERTEYAMADRAYQQELKNQMDQMKINLDLLGKMKQEMAGHQSDIAEKEYMKQAELFKLKENEVRMRQQQLAQQMEILKKLRLKAGDIGMPPSFYSEQDLLAALPQPPISAELPSPAAPLIESKPIGSIIDDLVDEKIIHRNEDISFILNNKVLKVNGILQSAELHKKLQLRYLTNSNDHVIYSISKGSTHADVLLNPK
jgi:beta-lactamase regulating signal transducer with metallopeptidase domain